MHVPSDEELNSLTQQMTQHRATSDDPHSHIPDPEPDIVERAQKLVSGGKRAGRSAASVTAEFGRQITEQEKLAFLAHVLGDAPFERQVELLGSRMVVVFRTPSASVSSRIDNWLAEKKISRIDHFNCMLAASVYSIRFGDGKPVRMNVFAESAEDGGWAAYQSWLHDIGGVRYGLLRESYKQFREALKTLIANAEDPDFWPTLSSQ